MNEVTTTREYLSRKEAADYLTKRWFRVSAATLAIRAMDGNGPRYSVTAERGGRSLYTVPDLDEWAKTYPLIPRGK